MISQFGDQFQWQPHIENAASLGSHARFIVCGMGGSALAPWVIKHYGQKSHSLTFHRDYGLPLISDEALKESLIIISSYSGDTEEALDAMSEAVTRGLPVAAISIGGRLIELSRDRGIPYVQMPDMHLQPRMALGLSLLATARLMQDAALEDSIRSAGTSIRPGEMLKEGGRLGLLFAGKVPLIYTSSANAPIGYLWKIKFNENTKIPAFTGSLPEWCHNELTGFDVVDSTRPLSASMHALFLQDDTDHPRIQKRMQVAGDILRERGIPVEYLRLSGEGFEKVFTSAILADWTTFDLARRYGVSDMETPLIADFKRRMAT